MSKKQIGANSNCSYKAVSNNFNGREAVVEPVETTGHFDKLNDQNKLNDLKAKIEQTAQKILDARALYPDISLADFYDETLMPPELRKAHRENDKAVMAAYGFDAAMDESEIVVRLFELYERMVKK